MVLKQNTPLGPQTILINNLYSTGSNFRGKESLCNKEMQELGGWAEQVAYKAVPSLRLLKVSDFH